MINVNVSLLHFVIIKVNNLQIFSRFIDNGINMCKIVWRS